jgi:hypothetical protein
LATEAARSSEIVGFIDKVADGKMRDWLDEARENRLQGMRDTRPDPKTYGIVAQAVHGILNVIGPAIAGSPAGPPGMIAAVTAFTGYDKYQELRDDNVDHDTALKGGAITGSVMGIGTALAPYYGQKLITQALSAIGINVGAGMVERAGIGTVLENNGYEEIAKHYKALDATAMSVDAVLALGFVGLGRYMKGRQ